MFTPTIKAPVRPTTRPAVRPGPQRPQTQNAPTRGGSSQTNSSRTAVRQQHTSTSTRLHGWRHSTSQAITGQQQTQRQGVPPQGRGWQHSAEQWGSQPQGSRPPTQTDTSHSPLRLRGGGIGDALYSPAIRQAEADIRNLERRVDAKKLDVEDAQKAGDSSALNKARSELSTLQNNLREARNKLDRLRDEAIATEQRKYQEDMAAGRVVKD